MEKKKILRFQIFSVIPKIGLKYSEYIRDYGINI